MKDKIVSITKLSGLHRTIDIELDGDHLFYANDLLTHNSSSSDSDPDMTGMAESFGVNATADLILALVSTEELEKLNQYLIKQLKNRYNSKTKNKRFVVGVDYDKMRIYDVEDSAQNVSGSGSSSNDSSFTPSGKSLNHLSSLSLQ